jgi:hypothetical protein
VASTCSCQHVHRTGPDRTSAPRWVLRWWAMSIRCPSLCVYSIPELAMVGMTESRRELRRLRLRPDGHQSGETPAHGDLQHLPGWDSEVHPPQPEGQPGPPTATSMTSRLHPTTRPPRPARRRCRHRRHPKRAVIGVVGRGLVAVGHHRARLNVGQHQTCADLNRSFRYRSRSETPA